MSRDPLIGSELGRYRITCELGAGGMGRVYEATQAESGALVAIKVLAERYARDASLIERFFAEARAANLIAHESICKVHDLAVLPDGRPYIVMERLGGTTLRTLLDEDPPPLGGILHVMLEVLSALAAAHAAGIIHRDLKPDNIFVTERGHAKVLDFGIAKLTGANAIARTQTGVVLGTPEYMAPEHISDGTADARTDLYAVGVVLFEALVGRRPFAGATDFELMRAHVSQPPPRVRSLRPDLPQALDDLIDRALAKRPADRFSSAASMANALRHVAAKISIEEWRPIVPGGRLMSPRPPPAPPLEPSAPRPATQVTVAERPRARAKPRRRRAWIVVAGALAAAGAGGAVIATQATTEDSMPAPQPVIREAVPALPVSTSLPVNEVAPPRVPVDDPKPVDEPGRHAGPPVPTTRTDQVPSAARAIDWDNFDWRVRYPEMLERARARAADAGFVGVTLTGVMPSGRVTEAAIYKFHSLTLPNATCEIRVVVSKLGTAVTQDAGPCGPPVPLPRCTPAQVRQKTRVLRTNTSQRVAGLVFARAAWNVFVGHDISDFGAITDDCAPGSWASTASDDVIEPVQKQRPLTAAEKPREFRQQLAATQALAHELERDAVLVGLGVTWRDGVWILNAAYRAKAGCIATSAMPLALDATRIPPDCGRSALAAPRCTPAQIVAKLKASGTIVFQWLGDEWRADFERGQVKILEDDC